MHSQLITLKIKITGDDSFDDKDMDRLTRNLLSEIKNLDVEKAQIPQSTNHPEGAKGEPVTLGTLAVVILPTLLPSLVLLIQHWLLRQQNQHIKVKIGSNEIEVPRDMPHAEIQKYISLLQTKEQS